MIQCVRKEGFHNLVILANYVFVSSTSSIDSRVYSCTPDRRSPPGFSVTFTPYPIGLALLCFLPWPGSLPTLDTDMNWSEPNCTTHSTGASKSHRRHILNARDTKLDRIPSLLNSGFEVETHIYSVSWGRSSTMCKHEYTVIYDALHAAMSPRNG